MFTTCKQTVQETGKLFSLISLWFQVEMLKMVM